MRKQILFVLIAMLFLHLPAAFCKTEPVFAKILRPATITFPAGIKRIILAERGCGKCMMGSNNKLLPSVPDTAAYSTLGMLKKELAAANRYSISMAAIDPSLLAQGKTQVLPALPREAIAFLTGNDSNALLIVLEEEDVSTPNDYSYEHRTWRIYRLGTETLLDEYAQATDYHSIIRSGNISTRLLSPAARFYACRILPHWEWASRDYYAKGNEQLKQGAAAVKKNNWLAASVAWSTAAADSSNTVISREACFDLAVYYEFSGDFDHALEWLAKAAKAGEPNATDYKLVIDNRKAEAPKLNGQLALGQGQLPAQSQAVYLQN